MKNTRWGRPSCGLGIGSSRGEFEPFVCKGVCGCGIRSIIAMVYFVLSPSSYFDDATYERTASSFDNPDFVDVVIHSYRHRYRYADGDPALEEH
jgi:hypothetical protein